MGRQKQQSTYPTGILDLKRYAVQLEPVYIPAFVDV
jgi:hypothetical protein